MVFKLYEGKEYKHQGYFIMVFWKSHTFCMDQAMNTENKSKLETKIIYG
jgi:hypothetical protein